MLSGETPSRHNIDFIIMIIFYSYLFDNGNNHTTNNASLDICAKQQTDRPSKQPDERNLSRPYMNNQQITRFIRRAPRRYEDFYTDIWRISFVHIMTNNDHVEYMMDCSSSIQVHPNVCHDNTIVVLRDRVKIPHTSLNEVLQFDPRPVTQAKLRT